MKYVILKEAHSDEDFMRVYPFIFPEYVTHKDVDDYMKHMLGMKEDRTTETLSAGFCDLTVNGTYRCKRGSESLSIKDNNQLSRRDGRILSMPNALQGVVMDDSCDA